MQPLELILFETDPVRARAAREQGVDALMFDVEKRGKQDRQTAFDTDISAVSLERLSEFVAISKIRPICRLDALHAETAADIDNAISGSAGELLFPMVRSVNEAEQLLKLVDGRVPAGIMIETKEILKHLQEISTLPLSRVYVGLNDLMISSGYENLFAPFVDGTVDRIRADVGGLRFGIAGATRVDRGSPLPFRLLLSEMARLDVHFTMLRRSFRRDVAAEEIGTAIREIAELWRALRNRSSAEATADHRAFTGAVAALGVIGRK